MNGRAEDRDTRLRISVVVPSWRDSENLAALLPALSRLDREHYGLRGQWQGEADDEHTGNDSAKHEDSGKGLDGG